MGNNGVRRGDGHSATRAPFLSNMKAIAGGPWMSGALVNHDKDIVVKIGPHALATQPPTQGNDLHEPEHRLTPSDPMLFDMDDAVQELQPVRAREVSTEKNEDETQLLTNLPDTDKGSEEAQTYTEAEPVEDVERLLQELDECSCRAPVTPASEADALLASADECNTDPGNDQQKRIRTLETHKEDSMQCPTSQQEVELGGGSNSLDQAKTRVQTEGQPEFQSFPPKPSKSRPAEPGAQGLFYNNLARVSNRPRSRGSLELIDRPSSLEEGFDDIRRLEIQGFALDRADQSSVAQRTGSKRQTPCRGIGEDLESSSAVLRDSSADRAARLHLSAELPINTYARHRANARSRCVRRSQPTEEPLNSAFPSGRRAASTFRRSCSSTLHAQASDSAPEIRSLGSPFGSRRQITVPAEEGPAAPAQGWIGDADGAVEADDAEAVWKKFVFGEGDSTAIDSAQEERVA
ncbi:gram-positive signal ysirk family [Diplodia corticola]|uniref:Gram-positive signal ysirk family n=1 Tax=Diplodia corticola TaxID=236234 RepID=A0A1J9R127_9PEZI|nr:gram-positive signal ysirk family [Diplodia corticola]OJD34313.1 gram-positive signal ysirk family [Diplodia corticola]